jgi:hypothetical protein
VANHLAPWRTDRHSGRAGAPGPGNAPFARVFGVVLGRLWRRLRPKIGLTARGGVVCSGQAYGEWCLPRLSRCCLNWRKPRESLRFASRSLSRPAHGHRLVRERSGKVRGQGHQSIPDDRSPRSDRRRDPARSAAAGPPTRETTRLRSGIPRGPPPGRCRASPTGPTRSASSGVLAAALRGVGEGSRPFESEPSAQLIRDTQGAATPSVVPAAYVNWRVASAWRACSGWARICHE